MVKYRKKMIQKKMKTSTGLKMVSISKNTTPENFTISYKQWITHKIGMMMNLSL